MSIQTLHTYQDSVSSFCIDDAGEDDVLDGVEDDAAVRLGPALGTNGCLEVKGKF